MQESGGSCSFARCAAPSTYTGYCDKVQTFIGASGASTILQIIIKSSRVCCWCLLRVAAKMELEMSCEICWRWICHHAIFDSVVFFCMERGLVQREGRAQWQPALEIGQDHALMARSALQSRWLGHVHICGGYLPQTIPYNEFREAPGITCAADLSYQGEVGGRL